ASPSSPCSRRSHIRNFSPPALRLCVMAQHWRKDPRIITMQKSTPIDSGVRIGHVHLKVADLDRALKFYCGVLGFELQQKFGTQAAFISAGGYHHHIG